MRPKQLRHMITGVLIATGLGLSAGQAMASEVRGTLDGEPREWHVVTHSQGSTASYHELMPGMLSVTIQSHREEKFETQGTLSIGFMVMQGQPGNASVTYFHESGMTPHFGTEEDVPIELEVLEFDGETGRVKGRVATSLAYVESMMTEHDHDNVVEIDVTFDVELVREE